jgi:hypothetical protein
MSLSDGERVIIALLCDIHRGLNLKGDVDPDAIRATILGTTAKADCAGEASAATNI